METEEQVEGSKEEQVGSFTLAALYSFFPVDEPKRLEEFIRDICKRHEILGNLITAREGINGTISGRPDDISAVIDAIQENEELRKGLEIKFSRSERQPFYRLRIRTKPEIVTMGVPDVCPAANRGEYVEPKEWNDLISRDDVIVIDTRNDYEVSIGTFKGAMNPETRIFKDFPQYVARNLDPSRHKSVAMFCTGGIRCEKASALMKEKGFENVYHLKGGILKYLETVKEEESLWEGECYVFDQRVSVKHNVEPGSYQQCRNCRMPLSPQDTAFDNPLYKEGVHCKYCIDSLTEEKRISLEERNRQIQLAVKKNIHHLGLRKDEISTIRSSKRRKPQIVCFPTRSIVVATRVHSNSASDLVNVEKIVDFAKHSSGFADKILILLATQANSPYHHKLQQSFRQLSHEIFNKIQVEIISPWIGFSTPLNVAVRLAIDAEFDYIVFQSLEFKLSASDLRHLMSCFDEDTLVVGPVLEGHDFRVSNPNYGHKRSVICSPISVPLRGRTCPWNTCAIWRLEKLGILGFPLIGDGITVKKPSVENREIEIDVIPGGVEELSAIAFAQYLYSHWTAKLVRLVDSTSSCHDKDKSHESSWDTKFEDSTRANYHQQKMKSKDARPAAQMSIVGKTVPQGHVLHFEKERS